MQKLTSDEYLKLVKSVLPKVSLFKTGIYAFLTGGFVCCLAEFFRFWFLSFNFNKMEVSTFVSLILIFITAVFTGFGLFHKIAKFGGAGTYIPITGFANSIVAPALEFKTEGFVLGMSSKMFIIAGPVLVYGVVSAMFLGFIFQICLWFGVIV